MVFITRRRWFSLIWVLIGVLGTSTGLHAEDAPPKPLYAICGAYPPELTALQQAFGVDAKHGFVRTVIGGVEFWRGSYRGKDLVVFRTGVSLVNAAYQLQLAIDHFPITQVFFAGVAGGTDPGLHVGDVVIPERWAYHSEAVYLNQEANGAYIRPDYFKPKYENFGMIFPSHVSVVHGAEVEEKETFAADSALLEVARAAVKKLPAQRKAGRDVTVSVGGTGVSGTVFLDNAPYREWVFRVWHARCLDMESTALAHVAYANGKPFLIVRGLSDLAGGQKGKNPIDQNEASVSEIAARTLRAIVDEL